MGKTKQKTLCKEIWQQDLESISAELSVKGFDIRRIKTLRRGIRSEGEPVQSFYRVVFAKKIEEQVIPEQQESDAREVIGTR